MLYAVPQHEKSASEIKKVCRSIGGREGWNDYEVFSRTMEAISRSLRNPVLRGDPNRWQANEDEWSRLFARCRKPSETMADMVTVNHLLIEAYTVSQTDFLSPLYMDFLASPETGQFFTPYGLCRMMAEMMCGNMKDELERSKKKFLTLQEPAVGAGGMVLAVAEVMKNQGLCPSRQAHWVCLDIDWKAICVANIQLTYCAVSADLVHGNTLTLDEWDSCPTIMAKVFPKYTRSANVYDFVDGVRYRRRQRPAPQVLEAAE